MSKLNDRDMLLRIIKGENLDEAVCYRIEYSLDIRGNITIWEGMSFLREERLSGYDDPKRRISRTLVPVYEYPYCYPYTMRVFQMEQEIDEAIPDDRIVEAFLKFREEHKTDGFGKRLKIIRLCEHWCNWDPVEELKGMTSDRSDRQEVLDRLLKQERQDILNLWGVDCPPDINNSENYGRRLMNNQGEGSEWFRQEFERIGGVQRNRLRR